VPLKGNSPRKVFEFLRDLYILRPWDDLTDHVIRSIPKLIPTDISSYNDMSSRRHFAAYQAWPADHPTFPDAPEALGRYSHQHPLVTYFEQTKNLTSRKITDFMSQREFRTTDLYNEFYRRLRLPYNMAMCFAVTGDSLLAIGLNRVKRDFEDDDVAMLDLLRPHLIQAYGNARVVSTMHEQLAAMQQSIEELDRAIVSVSDKGDIRWSTPRAAQLLACYGLQSKRRSNQLPLSLRDWIRLQGDKLNSGTAVSSPLMPLVIERDNRSLRIRFIQDKERRLLFFEEVRNDFPLESLKQLGLSRRETEILYWVAQGKSNPEIGTILGISPRTVQKHLERVYPRLGVENRHGAIAMALETALGRARARL
jgi:DNA-binding CsgD family transcriptional regulator